jgi:PST family polysaccharide transporter
VYALGIVLGALVGQVYGITGVAVGVLVVNIANFLIMAHLSLVLTGVAWSDFFVAHLPAVIMAGGVLAGVWPAEFLLNRFDLGSGVVVVGTMLIAAVAVLVTGRVAPHLSATRGLAATIESAQQLVGQRIGAVVARVLGPSYAPVTSSQGTSGG